jgi:addiction module RelE/StbE family toxin
MTMEVKISDAALRDFDDLPTSMQDRVLTVIERLRNWPNVSGAKLLTGNWRGHQRIRTGDYRVVFRIGSDVIRVERIAHRREVYD